MLQFPKGAILETANPKHLTFKDSLPYKTLLGATLPSAVDLTGQCGPVRNQGQTLSCVAFANTSMLTQAFYRKNKSQPMFSTEMLFYQLRGCTNSACPNMATQPSSAMYILQNTGVCLESINPWQENGYNAAITPSMITDAANHKIATFHAIDPQVTNDLKTALAAGMAVACGGQTTNEFDYPVNGVIAMPSGSPTFLGGHDYLLVGYDDSTGCFKMQNSWDTWWGTGGFAWIPYQYVAKYATIAYVIDTLADTSVLCTRKASAFKANDWVTGQDMTAVTVSFLDKNAGSPKVGDKIVQDVNNLNSFTLVNAVDFANNFTTNQPTPVPTPTPTPVPVPTPTPTPVPVPTPTPASGTSLPGIITMDKSTTRTGSCRLVDVNGQKVLGYVQPNDTITFVLNSTVAKAYKFQASAANNFQVSGFDVLLGTTKVASVVVNGTGGQLNWQTFNANCLITLPVGAVSVTLVATGGNWNLSTISFV